VVRS
jgi:hypothetical protein